MAICLLEGIDAVGKDTQSDNIVNYLLKKSTWAGPLQAHYGKSRNEEHGKLTYQSFIKIIGENYKDTNIVFNRSHLGEAVYSPMYRGYDGQFIFDYELQLIEQHPDIRKYVYLFVFVDDVSAVIKRDTKRNDGKTFSLDPEKKQQEIDLFKQAYENSNFTHKYLIDISQTGDANAVWKIIEREIANLPM
jgi:thymidylate kinase